MEAIDGLLSLYAKPLRAKKIKVKTQFEADGAGIESYPGAVRQVLSILLVNATEAVAEAEPTKWRTSSPSATLQCR